MDEATENPLQGIDIFAFMCYTKYALVNFYFFVDLYFAFLARR